MDLAVYPNTSNLFIKAGDKVDVICIAFINKTLVDVDVDIELHLVGPQRINRRNRVNNTSLNQHQVVISFPSISAENSGHYMCNASVQASSKMYFLNHIHKEGNFNLVLSKFTYINMPYFYFSSGQFPLDQRSIPRMLQSQKILLLLSGLRLRVTQLTIMSLHILTKANVSIHFIIQISIKL